MSTDSSSSGSFSSGGWAVLDDENQVKGFAFEVLRLHMIEQFGFPRLDEAMNALARHTREILDEPDINEWYSESEMRRILHVVHSELADRSDERYLELMRGVTTASINRFFRMILGLASGRFVLRNIPALWKRTRQGPATVRTEQLPDGRVLVHYENFRYCRDPIYRLTMMADCQAAAFAVAKQMPISKIERHSGVSMTLSFQFEE